MAPRSRYVPNPNPNEMHRSMLMVPKPIKFRRKNEEPTDGRGNGWQRGNLHGLDGDAPIVYSKNCGGWRTLSPELWEFSDKF